MKPLLVKSYEKKLLDYLSEFKVGDKVMVIFYLGLSDLLPFIPLYNRLRFGHRNLGWALGVKPGLGIPELFPFVTEVSLEDPFKDYAAVFYLGSGGRCTVKECCADIGLPYEDYGLPTIPHEANYVVALSLNALEDSDAHAVYNSVTSLGYLPMLLDGPSKAWDKMCVGHGLDVMRKVLSVCPVFVGGYGDAYMLAKAMNVKTILLDKVDGVDVAQGVKEPLKTLL